MTKTIENTVPAPTVKLSGVRMLRMEHVGLDQLRADAQWNVRKELTDIPALTEDIRIRGLIDPVTVVANGKPGVYRVVAGFRRFAALNSMARDGKPGIMDLGKIPVNVVEGTEADLLLLNLSENESRRSLTDFEVGARCLDLRKSFGLTGPQIAQQVPGGREANTINNLIRCAEKLAPQWLAKWREGQLKTREAIKLAALSPSDQAEELAKLERAADPKAAKGAKAAKADRGKDRETITKVLEYFNRCPRTGSDVGAVRTRGIIEALAWVLGKGDLGAAPKPEPSADVAKLLAGPGKKRAAKKIKK